MKLVLLLLAAACAACGVEPCPAHSKVTDDPMTCVCECGWQPDTDAGACVPLAEKCAQDVVR